jgi:hypothetical protein
VDVGLTSYDFIRLEEVEIAAAIDLYRAASPDARARHVIEVKELGHATCLTSRDIEPATMFRRALGLGVGRSATEAELDQTLACMDRLGERYVLAVAPQSQPPSLAAWLEGRGFTRGYAWQKFFRPCEGSSRTATELEVRVVGREHGVDFGRVVAEGFGLPSGVASWVAAVPGRPHWACVMAFAGDLPVAAGAVYVDGDHAWLGFGATLAAHRRRGAQQAILARRLAEAAARGARVAVTETGEQVPGKPSNSYRNIRRAGFEEAYLRQNYLSPAIEST